MAFHCIQIVEWIRKISAMIMFLIISKTRRRCRLREKANIWFAKVRLTDERSKASQKLSLIDFIRPWSYQLMESSDLRNSEFKNIMKSDRLITFRYFDFKINSAIYFSCSLQFFLERCLDCVQTDSWKTY